MTLTIHLCADCGSTIYKTGSLALFDGVVIVQAGTLDAGLESPGPPGVELFVKDRIGWVEGVRGVGQMQGFT